MRDQGNQDERAESRRQARPGTSVWRERALVLLIVACLGGTLNLVISVHHRALLDRERERAPVAPVTAPAVAEGPPKPKDPAPPPSPAVATIAKPASRAPSPPPPPVEDPARKALAELATATAAEIEAARQADRKVAAYEKARLAAVAESERWRRRELLVKQQVDSLTDRVRTIDRQIDEMAAQRDVLARERDVLKAAVAKAQQGEGSYAVLPYKGPNGSWRRPIVLECSNGSVTLRPKGPTFSMLDLSALINPRSSPVIVAIARELLRIQGSESPDGAPVVPYFVFLVRPDGIRPYYELRARLEPLGIAFGYELIEQDLKVDVPDFDNLATWDGTIPLDVPQLSRSGGTGEGPGGGDGGDGLAWPGSGTGSVARESGRPGSPGGGPGRGEVGSSSGDEDADSPDAFVWPTRRTTRGSRTLPPAVSGSAAPGSGTGVRGSADGSPEGPKPQGGRPGERSSRGGLNLALESPDAGQRGAGRTGRGGQRGGETVPEKFELQPAPGMAGGRGPSGQPGDGGHDEVHGEPAERKGTPSSGTGIDGPGAPRAPGRLGRVTEVAGLPELEAIQGGGGEGPEKGLAWPGGNTPADGSTTKPGGERARPGSGMTGTNRGQAAGGEALGLNPPRTTGSDPDSAVRNGGMRALAGLGDSGGRSAATAGAVGLGVGLPAGSGSGTPAASSGGSGMVLGSDAASATNPGQAGDAGGQPRIGSRIPDGPSPAIEVPFEITVVCQPSGLVIHPGSYQITKASLERNKKDGVLVRELLAVARQRAAADPAIRPQPRVRFLVENGGSTTFWNARKQILFSGLAWPMSLQISDAQGTRLLDPEDL